MSSQPSVLIRASILSDSPLISFMKFKPGYSSKVWEFQDPDTGFAFKSLSREGLIQQITQYRINNNLDPLEELGVVLDHYLCSHPVNGGLCRPEALFSRGLRATFRGGIALFKSLLYGSYAPQAVADARAEQCIKCPFNFFPEDKPAFERYLDAAAVASVGKRRSKDFKLLGECGVCRCPLRSKVFFTGKSEFPPEQLTLMKSVNCWQLNG